MKSKGSKDMKDSVLIDDMYHCIICDSDQVQRHHVFYGKNRKNSDEDGFWVPLCMRHHTGTKYGVHHNKGFDLILKVSAQKIYEETHTREEFIRRYGKSYL